MVPRQFDALLRRHKDRQIRLEYGPAIICQTIHALAKSKVPIETFMPSWKRKTKHEVSWQEHLAKAKILHAAFGGAS
jgi:hypothetical protein